MIPISQIQALYSTLHNTLAYTIVLYLDYSQFFAGQIDNFALPGTHFSANFAVPKGK